MSRNALPNTDGEWVELFLGMAEAANERCGEALASPTPNVAAARAASREAEAGLAGLRKFVGRMRATLRKRMSLVGAAIAVAAVVAVAIQARPKQHEEDMDDRRARQSQAEREVGRLIRAGDLRAAQRIIDTELDSPLGWHLRGELETVRGKPDDAAWWYRKAATAGFRPAERALTAIERRRATGKP